MRYLVAMIVAAAVAALAFAFVAMPIADWLVNSDFVVNTLDFQDPEDSGNFHALAFMTVCIGGLLIGWLAGWAIGAPLTARER